MVESVTHNQNGQPEEFPANRSLIWLARFMTEDSDNLVFRRFDELRILQILCIQDEIIHYSESLSWLRQSGKNEGLVDVFAKLRKLLPEYGTQIC